MHVQNFWKVNKSWQQKRCGRNHILYIFLKQYKLACWVCLSMYDLLLPPGVKGLKVVLEIRNTLPAVFFEKAVLRVFRKFLQKHPWQSWYLNICKPSFGKCTEYCISSNKHQVWNKCCTFGYLHWNKRFPLISVAPLNVVLLEYLLYSTSS